MTSDSSILSALRSLISHVNVLTTDGTSLPISSRGTLSTFAFSVPDISLPVVSPRWSWPLPP
jgi:hypothetical protein